MKAEPDRLDLLIVVIPFILVGVLGVQVYRYVQTSGEPDTGSQLAREILSEGSESPESGSSDPGPAGPPAGGEAATADGAPGTADGAGATVAGAEGGDDAAVAGSEAGAEVAAPAGGTAGDATDAAASTVPDAGPAEAAGGAAVPAAAGTPANVVASPDASTGTGSSGTSSSSGGSGGASGGTSAGTPTSTPASAGITAGVVTAPATSADEVPGETSDDAGGGSSSLSAGSGSTGGGVDDPVDPAQPMTILAIPLIPQAKVGQVVPVEIHITNGTNVGSVPFHLAFKSDVLQLNDAPRSEKGPFLSVPGYDTQFLTAVGPGGNEVIVGLSLMGARSGASGSGVLATLYFLALAPGTTPLAFTHATVRGPDATIQMSSFLPGTVTVTE